MAQWHHLSGLQLTLSLRRHQSESEPLIRGAKGLVPSVKWDIDLRFNCAAKQSFLSTVHQSTIKSITSLPAVTSAQIPARIS